MRRVSMIAIGLASLLFLTACANSSNSDGGGSVSASTSASSPRATPTPTSTPGATSFNMDIVDAEGYHFTVGIKMSPIALVVDTADAAPGKAELQFSGSGTATFTNTTPGKNAPTSNLVFSTNVGAFWPEASGVCAAVTRPLNTVTEDSFGDTVVPGPTGCALLWIIGEPPTAGQPPAAYATLPYKKSFTMALLLVQQQRSITVSEAAAAQVKAAVANQSQVWVGTGETAKLPRSGYTATTPGQCGFNVEYGNIQWASAPVADCAIPVIGGAVSG
jgi:hypothetical protein